MTCLAYVDYFDPVRDTDSTPKVVQIYRHQFPELYRATDGGKLRT